MIVFYIKDGHDVIGWTRTTPDLVIDADGVRSADLVMQGVDWSRVEYKEIIDQEIERKYDQRGFEVFRKLEELNLLPAAPVRDLAAEIDALKARIKALDAKVV